jgi:hypothetical protein
MLRFEFIEFMTRIVKGKYIETGHYQNYEQAFNQFFREFYPNWQKEPNTFNSLEWRLSELWTLDVNDCLEANKEGL